MAEAKKILLGVTGGIAAYKAAALTSALVKAGVAVRVIMTAAATRFVGPLTFQALSGGPVYRDMFATPGAGAWEIEHIALARWPDLVLVCPATADIIARAAAARADDLLAAVLLATARPVYFVPAMNAGMWCNRLLRARVAELEAAGCRFIGPARGRLACGEEGAGRMVEVEEVLACLRDGGFLPGRPPAAG